MTLVARHSSAPVARMHRRRGFILPESIRPGKEMLARVAVMLTRLIDRFDVDDPLIRKDWALPLSLLVVVLILGWGIEVI
jgi:hypothetical protein